MISNSPLILRLVLLYCCMFFAYVSQTVAASAPLNTAFYYGPQLPLAELAQYDDLIVEPAQLSASDRRFLAAQKTRVFAYLSLGEVTSANARAFELKDDWFLARNDAWNSRVPDQSNTEWRRWLIEEQVKPLQAAGYDGLFLDTLDSFHLAVAEGADADKQIAALKQTILQIREVWPGCKLYFNRGFELIDDLRQEVYALAAESLYEGWDASKNRYRPVPQEDRDWLLEKLKHVKALGVPVTVIDYLPADQQDKARTTAKEIAKHGFSPWVSNPALDLVGTGLVNHVPRKVLVIYDSHYSPLEFHPAHVALGGPFDYLGLVAQYHDIRTGIPQLSMQNVFAGVIVFLSDSNMSAARELNSWARNIVNSKLPLVIFGHQPFTDSGLKKQLGLSQLSDKLLRPLSIIHQDKLTEGFETKPKLRSKNAPLTSSNGVNNESLLSISDAAGKIIDPVVIGPWGGMALEPYSFRLISAENKKWVIDPINFLRRALQLNDLPIPDATTLNGLRILTSHIDGDGFPSRAEFSGTPFSAEVIYTDILKKYQLPHTVSVIEGEIGPKGLYPELSPALEEIARKIFRLKNVELASHSFSHPFFWQPEKLKGNKKALYGVSMPIPNYTVDMQREIVGSIDYINSRLAPKNKKVKVMLWTGDALPGEEAIEWTKKMGVVNMNGGNTMVTRDNRSLTEIYPQVRATKAGLQIYAPIMNENVYTNDWTGPFYGFKRVIETFEITESPRRLKPISIYWHFYSGTKKASLRALDEVYAWAVQQEHIPLFISDYSPMVEGTYYMSLNKLGDKSWSLRGLGALRTLRLPDSLGYPDLDRSQGIAGWRDTPGGRYLHLSANEVSLFTTSSTKSRLPRLHSANGQIARWKSGDRTELNIRGEVPLIFSVVASGSCKLTASGKIWNPDNRSDNGIKVQQFSLPTHGTGDAVLVCK